MALSKKDVDYIAKLARLALSDKEKKQFLDQLAKILGHVSKLNELDTDNVPPTSHVLALKNVWRKDVVVPSSDPETIMSNAPDREGPYFKVKKVIE